MDNRSHSEASYSKDWRVGATQYILDERRRAALAEIDNALFVCLAPPCLPRIVTSARWFHVKVCLVAAAGFFCDSYDIFAINIGAQMIGYVYGTGSPRKLTTNRQDLGLKVALPVGTLFGQLLFGWLADIVGRKRMYGVELIIIIIGTFAQALSGGAHAVSIIGVLVVWRFFTGIGVGGDYPLSATIASEFASTKLRGRLMTMVFSAQGWGNFTAVLVAFIVTEAFKNKIIAEPSITDLNHVDYMWRILLGLGCLPAVFAIYYRLTLPETPRFTMDIERNVMQAADDIDHVLRTGRFDYDPDAIVQRADAPRASLEDFRNYFGRWENLKVLIGTSYSWFALDIAFYGLGLNSATILTAIGFGSPATHDTRGIYQALHNVCVGNLIFSVAGLIPGYYATFALIDSWGRKPIQLMGFTVLTVLFLIMGFGFNALQGSTAGKGAFVFLYCLTNFFQNFGPNTTTFIIPGEVFPTRYRSTAHGISAASGKFGAIIAQVGFGQLLNIGGTNKFIPHIMEILAFFMMTGIFSTLLLPETKQKSLEELSNERQEGFLRGPTTQVKIHNGIIMGTRL
ncbi:phosphate transporter [Roridomyces roridus]|uniref:Phosphate transporter n=1 Tax=Roridomyces roridus TaxID=1738132 RepID=A0AAD7BFQ2_9AGAR|nr:phosphate transporter [Roridomyces roridus]